MIVPLERHHFDDLEEEVPPNSLRGMAAVEDGKCIGAAGSYHYQGHVMVYLYATEALRRKPLTLMRLAKSIKRFPHRIVYAHCDPTIEAASRFLEHFGFRDRGDGIYVRLEY